MHKYTHTIIRKHPFLPPSTLRLAQIGVLIRLHDHRLVVLTRHGPSLDGLGNASAGLDKHSPYGSVFAVMRPRYASKSSPSRSSGSVGVACRTWRIEEYLTGGGVVIALALRSLLSAILILSLGVGVTYTRAEMCISLASLILHLFTP